MGQNNRLDNKRTRDINRLDLDKRQVKKISRPETREHYSPTRENHRQKQGKRQKYAVVRQETRIYKRCKDAKIKKKQGNNKECKH